MADTIYKTGCIATPRNRIHRALIGLNLMARAKGQPPAPPCYDGTGGVKDWDVAGNSQYGDCVVADEANYKKAIGPVTGGVEVQIPAKHVIDWYFKATGGADRGLNIEMAMNRMRTIGLVDAAGIAHTSGRPGSINHTDQEEVRLAIQHMKGLKIGVASGPLMRVVQPGKSGWVLTGVGNAGGVDHCVEILGYGTAGYLAALPNVNAKLPGSLSADAFSVVLFTWGSIGVVDWPSFQAITGEAWVRITDPDRGDKATWDPVADEEFAEITGDQPEPPQPPTPDPGPGPGPQPGPSPRPCPRFRRAAQHIARGLVNAAGEFMGGV